MSPAFPEISKLTGQRSKTAMPYLSEILLSMPQGFDRIPLVRIARAALRTPANTTMEVNDLALGMCDRFVLTRSFYDACRRQEFHDEETRVAFFSGIKEPLPTCWIEFDEGMRRITAKETYGVRLAWFIQNGLMAMFVCMRFSETDAKSLAVLPLVYFNLEHFRESFLQGENPWFQTTVVTQDVIAEGFLEKAEITDFMMEGAYFIASLACSRVAVIQRVAPASAGPAGRAFARRRLARGRPMFSYNKVTLAVPQVCTYRGGTVETQSLAGKRGHMVVGHWRLIDNVAVPFFTWIEGHESGDRALGWITKEHMVSSWRGAGGMRRGFLIPDEPGGGSGDRRPALPAATTLLLPPPPKGPEGA
jgi:hypothetical protein